MAKPQYPSEKLDQYMVRLPDGMRDRIKAAADTNNRSMNAEIVATLEKAYPAPVMVPVNILALADYMNFIESAETEEELENFLIAANESLLRDDETSAFEIQIGADPEGRRILFVGRRAKVSDLLPDEDPFANLPPKP